MWITKTQRYFELLFANVESFSLLPLLTESCQGGLGGGGRESESLPQEMSGSSCPGSSEACLVMLVSSVI